MRKNRLLLLLLFFVSAGITYAQTKVSGTIKDTSGEPLPGANILEKGTSNGTTTDFDGNFTLSTNPQSTLVISFSGFETQEIAINGRSNINVVLKEGLELEEVVITGNRTKPRTILDSPVPIDNINVKELQNSGKATFDRMLVFKVPSFNSQNQAISDATAHYDPADLRGLGPSRTLVLVNGKRKNQSAQVYLNRTPGKGEVGVDLKSIPTAAIKRVEVLRDGAAAQYGSDAIAGVMNIILKKDVEFSTFTTKAGITSKKDGFNFGADYNTAFTIGDEGYINLTLGYYNQKLTNRAGTVVAADEGAGRNYEKAWLANNPTANMTVGQPDMEKKDLFINMEHPLGEKATLYSFHGYTTRTGKSFAYYRAPYWRSDVADSKFITGRTEDFIGYQPTFETAIDDHINSVGIKSPLGEKWHADASVTYGSNDVFYTVNNSVNRDYLKDKGYSPRSFQAGGFRFSNVVGNLDFSGQLSEQISLATGIEYKKEKFRGFAGDAFSYYKGGADSFAGIKPEEAISKTRSSFATYAQLDYDVTENLLFGLAGRYENFSITGDNFSWKINGRYKLGNKGAIRASYSTGFRAPSLHQRFITLSQYIIVAGSNEPVLQGTLSNTDPAVQALGVPKLTHEIARNVSAGLTYKINPKFSASLDFYQINVDDRVLFSSQIAFRQDAGDTVDLNGDGKISGDAEFSTDINPIEQILIDNKVSGVQFFINAGSTKTVGADLILNYQRIQLGEGKLNVNLAANFNTTTIDKINTPKGLADNGYSIFDRREEGLITSSRPKSKFILGLGYDINKWSFSLNNTRFGEVTVISNNDGQNSKYDQTLSSKISTDFGLTYNLTERISLNGNINNIFNVYPDVTNMNTGTTANGRFDYSSEVQQLGQLGTNFSVGLNIQF